MIRSFMLFITLVMGSGSLTAEAQTTAVPSAEGSSRQIDASQIPDDAPNWTPITEAAAQAQNEGKPLLIHAYAAWCSWCYKSDHEVYTDDSLQALVNKNFVLTRLDIESSRTIEFFDWRLPESFLAMGLGASGTPTTIFFQPDGDGIMRVPGFQPLDPMMDYLRFVSERAYTEMSFNEYIAQKDRGDLSGEDAPDDEEAVEKSDAPIPAQ